MNLRNRFVNRLRSVADRLEPRPEPVGRAAYEMTIVISGQPVSVGVPSHFRVFDAMRQAAELAGVRWADTAGWEIRTEDGTELLPGARLSDTPIVPGATLFMQPQAGGGGSADRFARVLHAATR